MEPIPNVFPAAVDAETYWRVNRKLSTKAPRGRHAPLEAKSIVSGIAFCATCGHAVTRVSKGDYVYLVCSRANMRAGGCRYLAVPYSTVEDALRKNAHRLVKDAPRGQSTAALEKQIDALQHNADGAEALMDDLVELIAGERGSPEATAAAKRLRQIERELKETQKQLRALRAQRDTMTTASVRGRLKAVEKALGATGTTVGETNRALREAIRRVVIDPEQGMLWVRWHHSDEVQDVHCFSRHKDWTEFRETTTPMNALFPEKQEEG